MKPTSNVEKQYLPTCVLFLLILKVFDPIQIMKFGHLVIFMCFSILLSILRLYYVLIKHYTCVEEDFNFS